MTSIYHNNKVAETLNLKLTTDLPCSTGDEIAFRVGDLTVTVVLCHRFLEITTTTDYAADLFTDKVIANARIKFDYNPTHNTLKFWNLELNEAEMKPLGTQLSIEAFKVKSLGLGIIAHSVEHYMKHLDSILGIALDYIIECEKK